MNKKVENPAISGVDRDRRSSTRTREDADWESKVLGRVGGHLRNLPDIDTDHPNLGWETTVLDTLRRRIERGPK